MFLINSRRKILPSSFIHNKTTKYQQNTINKFNNSYIIKNKKKLIEFNKREK